MQEDLSWPLFRAIDENARATLQNGSPEGILIFGEHLDRIHFPDPQMQANRAAGIKQKYANSNLDLVIGVGEVPTDLFPGVPLLYLGTGSQRQVPHSPETHRRSAGLWVDVNAGKTLDAARRFQPSARQVVVIGGSTPSEKVLIDQVREEIENDLNPLRAVYLTNLSFGDISTKVAALGPESIVLFVSLGRDGVGHFYVSTEAVGKIAAVSGAPVYVVLDTHMRSGVVGGYVTRFGEMGKQAGEMGLQLLAGQYPKDQIARSDYVFDWRQLRRWNIPPTALPVGSIVINRRPTVWESYKWYILGATLLFLLEALLILGLLWQRAKMKKFGQSLHNLTSRLISAQEEERSRIARELHDDFSQRLALLGIGLGQLWKKLSPKNAEERASILDMLEGTKEMSSDMHSLSHQLHSSKLEHVGLAAALNGLCKEIGQKYDIDIQFTEGAKALYIPQDVALSLFRVAQEALANVVKHSGSTSAQVEFREKGSAVTLRISDSGRGFDPSSLEGNAGIGMIGMSERMRIVGGQLVVKSQPNRGTEIFAQVPLAAAEDTAEIKSQVAGKQNLEAHTRAAGG